MPRVANSSNSEQRTRSGNLFFTKKKNKIKQKMSKEVNKEEKKSIFKIKWDYLFFVQITAHSTSYILQRPWDIKTLTSHTQISLLVLFKENKRKGEKNNNTYFGNFCKYFYETLIFLLKK